MHDKQAIERLINAAESAGIDAVAGRPATRANLDLLAHAARAYLLRQADAGLWEPWGVYTKHDLYDLSVVAALGFGDKPITLAWNFSGTPLAAHVAIRTGS